MILKDRVKYTVKQLNYTNSQLARDLGLSKQALDIKITQTQLFHRYELVLLRNFLRRLDSSITIDAMLDDGLTTEEMFEILLSSHKSKRARYNRENTQ